MGFNLPIYNQITRQQPVSPSVWVRQADWISITGVSTGQVIFLASDATNGKYTIRTTSTGGGNIYIDWGDGSSPDTISSGSATDTSHTFTTGGTACSLGYNTWKITITSDGGTRITGCQIITNSSDFAEYPSGLLEAWYGDTTITTAASYFNEQSGTVTTPWFTYLEYVKLPEGMTATNSLERVFFNGCRMLKRVDMPTSCPNNQTLQETFYECNSLVDPIVFPQDMTGVTTCTELFTGCYSLQKVVYPPTFPNCTTINRMHFNNWALGECNLPVLENCTNFTLAFSGCFSLRSANISKWKSSATITLSSMFASCQTLTNVTLPNDTPSTTTIVIDGMFTNAYSIKSIIFPPDVKVSGSLASTFSGCDTLTYLSFPNDISAVTSMASFCAGCNSLQTFTLPNIPPSVAIPMNSAFATCFSLSELIIPTGYTITTVALLASGCRSLKTLVLPNNSQNSITTMAQMAQNCGKLKSVTLPTSLNGVTTITSMFNACYSLESVVFPSSMPALTIISSAFLNCVSLEQVTLPTSISGNNVGCFGNTFNGCFRIKEIVYPATLTSPTVPNTMVSDVQNCYSLRSLTLPASQLTALTTVASMFQSCYALTGITNSSFLGNTSTSATVYMNGVSMGINSRSVQSLSFSGKFSQLALNGTGSGVNQSALSSLRLLNNGSGQYAGTSPQINVSFTSMDATALNQLFTDLPTVTSRTITVVGCPGAATCNTSIATAKGWTVTTV
jgi:hypothetical protein